jgi:hypothetical protein
MTKKTDFDQQEWDLIAEGPATAGMIVIRAEGGGTFRETIALAHAYADARKQHGQSELLDEIVSVKPKFERYDSSEELHEEGMQRLRDATAALESKATPDEIESYRGFVLALAKRVAEAHKEGGERVSQAEQSALDEIESTLGSGSSA